MGKKTIPLRIGRYTVKGMEEPLNKLVQRLKDKKYKIICNYEEHWRDKHENGIQPTYAQAIQDSSVHKVYFSSY